MNDKSAVAAYTKAVQWKSKIGIVFVRQSHLFVATTHRMILRCPDVMNPWRIAAFVHGPQIMVNSSRNLFLEMKAMIHRTGNTSKDLKRPKTTPPEMNLMTSSMLMNVI